MKYFIYLTVLFTSMLANAEVVHNIDSPNGPIIDDEFYQQDLRQTEVNKRSCSASRANIESQLDKVMNKNGFGRKITYEIYDFRMDMRSTTLPS